MIWIPFEDQSEQGVLWFALAICGLLAARGVAHHPPVVWSDGFKYALVGICAGLLVVPVALFLMALKTGAHSHGIPDFTLEHIQAVIARGPVLALGGALIGLGAGLWWHFRK